MFYLLGIGLIIEYVERQVQRQIGKVFLLFVWQHGEADGVQIFVLFINLPVE